MVVVSNTIREHTRRYLLLIIAFIVAIVPGAYVIYNTYHNGEESEFHLPLFASLASITNSTRTRLSDCSIHISLWQTHYHQRAAALADRALCTLRDYLAVFSPPANRFFKTCAHYLNPHFRWDRNTRVVVCSAIPAILRLLAHLFGNSSLNRRRTAFVNVAQFVVVFSWYFEFRVQDLLAASLIMMGSFDVFQRALDPHASSGNESQQQFQANASVVETNLTRSSALQTGWAKQSHRSSAESKSDSQSATNQESGGSVSRINAAVANEGNALGLQCTIADLKTANKAKDLLLCTTKDELKNARETLNETFAKYTRVRDEMKTIKQKMSREHQAVVYRKDIELFALRKGNEQKEKYIKEHDEKLDEVFKQQKATVELKDAQLKMLKERLALLDSPRPSQDGFDGDQALEVRLLRVKKGKSPTVDAEKDATIAKLEEQLQITRKAAEKVVNQQGELQRAWDVTKTIQASLRDERDLHSQTKAQLQEMTVRFEEEANKNAQSNVISRLPTIEEDKNELEAMFDTAQEDNLRLYAEVEVLEKRLREANSRMFIAEQETAALREQLTVEKAISHDLEAARPSIVHRVHFQRMESQLQTTQDTIQSKEDEIHTLQNTVASKDRELRELRGEVDAAVSFHTQDQDEIESLKKSMAELQATKEQLMRDHERLASQRARPRLPLVDHTSARSSGATLIQDLSPPLSIPLDEALSTDPVPPMPDWVEAERPSSIQETPTRHLRTASTPNRWSLMSNETPPEELRHSRRKSLGFKDLMKRMVKKDTKIDMPERPATTETPQEVEKSKARAELDSKDKSARLRPKTAAPAGAAPKPVLNQDPFYSAISVPLPQNIRPTTARRNTRRYYALDTEKAEDRPSTSAGSTKGETSKPFRLSWGASVKLKRRSLY